MATIEILEDIDNEIDLKTNPTLELDNYDLIDFEELKFDFDDLLISVDENSTNFKLDENLRSLEPAIRALCLRRAGVG